MKSLIPKIGSKVSEHVPTARLFLFSHTAYSLFRLILSPPFTPAHLPPLQASLAFIIATFLPRASPCHMALSHSF